MVSNYLDSNFASVLPLALDHLGAGQDQGLQAGASKSVDRACQPHTKGYSGGLVWARSEQRGSTSPLHEFVLLPGTGVLTLRGGSRSARDCGTVDSVGLLCFRWLLTRWPAARADIRLSSPARTVPQTILASWLAFSPGKEG
jgi:hypothetical protein